MTDRQRLLELLRTLSVRWGNFTLASGATSSLYIDARQTTLHQAGCALVGRLVLGALHPEVVGVGGLTLGADPIVAATVTVGAVTGRPVHGFLVRKQPKAHGTGHGVEGLTNLPLGSKVCVVEDTTTTGGSLLTAVRRARDAGLEVVQCLTLIDREEGARERLSAEGLQLEALFGRSDLTSS